MLTRTSGLVSEERPREWVRGAGVVARDGDLPMLDRKDRLLLAVTLPLFVAVLSLHVDASFRTGLAQLPVFAAWHPGDYPTVGGFRLETDSSGSGLQLGDRLIRIGEQDLRDQGYVGVQAIGLARTQPGQPTTIEIERAGLRRVLPLEARPHPAPWSRVPTLLITAAFPVLLLLRAPRRTDVRRYYLCFMTYAIAQAHFYGGPEWQTYLAHGVWFVGSVLMVFFLMNWVRSFPPELASRDRISPYWSWGAAGLYLVFVRSNYLLGWPLPIRWVPTVSFATHGIATVIALGVLTHNYRRAPVVGQRRLRWILFGTAVGSLPVVVAGLAPLVQPEWSGFRVAFALGFVSSLVWMVGSLLAVVRDNAFDIDRLIGATATLTLAVGFGGAGIVVLVPYVSDLLASAYAIDSTSVRIGLAALVGAGIMTSVSRLRPRIDALLFRDQLEEEERARVLSEALRETQTVEALLEAALSGCVALMGAAGGAAYVRVEGGYTRRVAEGRSGAAVLSRIPGTDASAASGWLGLDPFFDAVVLIRAEGESAPSAVVAVRRSESGDLWSHRRLRLLATIGQACEREWHRLRRETAEAESAAKTNLLAEASHDLRQPLHAVSILAETLERRLDDPEVAKLVQRIGHSTSDLDEMLTGLLDRSRLDAETIVPSIEPVRVQRLLEALERDFGGPAAETGTRLRFVDSGLTVRTDRVLVLRLLRNLVSNALRHAGGGRVLVGVRRVGATRVRFEVRDDGPGISLRDQERVFEAFVQLPGGERSGLGLGLSIVRGLSGILAAPVELGSTPGKGTTFSVTLDRAGVGQVLEEEVTPPIVAPGIDRRRGGVRRALVVDDDRAVRESMLLLLAEWGWEARGARSLEEVECVLSAGFAPTVVLSDYHLEEGVTGLDVREQIVKWIEAARGEDPAFVFLMAEKRQEEWARVAKTGARALRKPVRPARLRSVLQGPA